MNPILKNHKNLLTQVRGVIQAGMGAGSEEISVWRKYGIQNQIYIEPYPPHFRHCVNVVAPLSDKVRCFQVALSDVDGLQLFNLCNEGDSHSLLNFSENRAEPTRWMHMYDSTLVQCRRLDTLIEMERLNVNDFNLLFLDTQFTEHLVLKGVEKYLQHFDYITAEVSNSEILTGALMRPDFDRLMCGYGFVVETESLMGPSDDVLYVRKV